MVPLRLLTFLFLSSNASKLVTGTGTGNQVQVPCEDETKTVPTTTTKSPTTSGDPCQAYPGTTAYRRQNGWFCSMNQRKIRMGQRTCRPNNRPQPKVIDPNGKGVYTINKDSSVPGLGSLSIVPTTGVATPNVRGIICGGPGDY
ncbi:hypothetical protein CAEBREN_20326 [Caenorhabditis brenneri]|uniref:Secreted protein n=1 Tax=Caenorhabditis brenneri TaxID=135651 RepID=G0NHK1_CAEBE|nr:hypothetical protein CAEBREN_20326 [Caenorhabditis brenneri]